MTLLIIACLALAIADNQAPAQPAENPRAYNGAPAVPFQPSEMGRPSEGTDPSPPSPTAPSAGNNRDPAPTARPPSAPDSPATQRRPLRWVKVRGGFLGALQYRVGVEERNATPGFALPLARPALQASFWDERVALLLQAELAGSPSLLDATASIQFHPAFELELGQYRPWFTRGFRTPLFALALPGRGRVVDTFRVDRDLGATVLGRPLGGKLEYYVGVFNGQGRIPVRGTKPGLLVTGRVVAAPLGPVPYDQTELTTAAEPVPFRFALALNGATNELNTPPPDPSAPAPATGGTRDLRVGGDAAIYGGRVYAQAEGFMRTTWTDGARSPVDAGAYGLLSVVLAPKRVDAALRAGWLRQHEQPTSIPIEPAVNIYFAGNHAKLQLRYACFLEETGGCTRHEALAHALVWF